MGFGDPLAMLVEIGGFPLLDLFPKASVAWDEAEVESRKSFLKPSPNREKASGLSVTLLSMRPGRR